MQVVTQLDPGNAEANLQLKRLLQRANLVQNFSNPTATAAACTFIGNNKTHRFAEVKSLLATWGAMPAEADNVVVFLHGLGDTEQPYAMIGEKMAFPRTAVLALRAPDRYISCVLRTYPLSAFLCPCSARA